MKNPLWAHVSPSIPFCSSTYTLFLLHVQNTTGTRVTAVLLHILVYGIQYFKFMLLLCERCGQDIKAQRSRSIASWEKLEGSCLWTAPLYQPSPDASWVEDLIEKVGLSTGGSDTKTPRSDVSIQRLALIFGVFPSTGASRLLCEATAELFISGTNNDTKSHPTFLFCNEDMVCSLVLSERDTSWHLWGQQCECHCLRRTQLLSGRHLKDLSHSSQMLHLPLIWRQDFDHSCHHNCLFSGSN